MQRIGSIDGDDVHLVRLALPNGAAATISTYGATLTDLVVPDAAGTPVRVVLGYDDLAAYRTNLRLSRRHRRPLRQPHPRRPLHPRRAGLRARPQRERPHPPARWRRRLRPARVWRSLSPPTTAPPPSPPPRRTARRAIPAPSRRASPTASPSRRRSVSPSRRRPTRRRSSASPTTATSPSTRRDDPRPAPHPRRRPLPRRLTPSRCCRRARVAPVAGTPYDFRTARPIGGAIIDHFFVLDRGEAAADAPSAPPGVDARSSGLALECAGRPPWRPGPRAPTSSPRTDPPGRRGVPTRSTPASASRPSSSPTPQPPALPSAVLRPGEVWRQATEYRFEAARGGAAGDRRRPERWPDTLRPLAGGCRRGPRADRGPRPPGRDDGLPLHRLPADGDGERLLARALLSPAECLRSPPASR